VIPALVQASRQAGGELAGGQLRRLVVDAPPPRGEEPGGGGSPPAAAALEVLLHTSPSVPVVGALWSGVLADSSPERDAVAQRLLVLALSGRRRADMASAGPQ
jgi:hypothetical protein